MVPMVPTTPLTCWVSVLPLYKSVVVGLDAYHEGAVLRDLIANGTARRAWFRGTTPVSVMLGTNKGVVKSIDGFDLHAHDENAFMAMLEECAVNKVERPSSYADVFHQRFFSPRIPYTVNRYFMHEFAGGWQEAREHGLVRGHLFKYDMNAAYLWSGTQGLPLPSTFSYVEGRVVPNALHVLEIEPEPHTPFPFNRARIVLAERDDVEAYNLRVKRVVAGVQWSKLIDGDEILRVVERFSFGKRIGQSYWGRWASRSPVGCATYKNMELSKKWNLRNPTMNFLWAQLIVNRVKRRVFLQDPSAVHVFVDSIITRTRIRHLTEERGGWKFVADYPNGLNFLGAGFYGEPGGPLIRRAGVAA